MSCDVVVRGPVDGLYAVRIALRLNDVVVVALTGVDVVVVGVHPGRPESLGLAVLEQAQAGADLDAGMLLLDRLGHLDDLVDITVGGASPRGDHAHSGCAAAQAGTCLPKGLVLREP